MNAFFTEEQIELIKNFPLLTFSELINKNIEEYIITFLIGIVSPYIVNCLHKKRKSLILYLLNEYLIHEKNPILNLILKIGFCILFIGSTCYLYNDRQPIFIILMPTFIILVIHFLFNKYYNKDKKGLVGILSHDFKSVKEVNYTDENNDIYFVKTENDKGEKLSYEERQIITTDNDIEKIIEKIKSYYELLKEEISEQSKIKEKHFIIHYNNKDWHICDFMIEVYSKERIKMHINRLAKNMSEDNSINFIGDKIGVSGYTIEKKILSLDIYMTDHFTFNVFKSIFKEAGIKDVFQTIIRRVNIVNEIEQRYLVRTMKFLFSSFGIDIIIHGITSDKKRAMLLGLRSGKIEKNGECKIHVPVNESFSRTDKENNGKYNLYVCVKRGIEEELGIPQNLIKDECISFHDFAMVSDAGEIGLGCYVDLSKIMSLEQARLYPGQDKYMEMDNLIIVPYPPFYWNPDKYVDYFYKSTYNDLLTTPWESFTPLLYQRLVIRNMALNNKKIYNICLAFVLTLIYFLCISTDTGWYSKLVVLTASAIISIITTILSSIIYNLYHRIKVVSFKPLIPQWGGDVKVLQSTNPYHTDHGNTNQSKKDSSPVASEWYFCINENEIGETENSFKLSSLKLMIPPLCKVRRELANGNESPIGFFVLQNQNDNIQKSKLFFSKVPINNPQSDRLSVELSIVYDENYNYTYRFIQQIEEPELIFDNEFSDDKKNSYSHLFSLSKSFFSEMKYANISQDFKDRYIPLDLFQYRGNYYWSVFEKSGEYNNDNKVKYEINENTVIYKDCISKNLENKNKTLLLEGSPQIVVEKISNFIANKLNRKRISSLDIYMLQLALIRQDNNLVLGIKQNKWFYYGSVK